MIEFSFGVAGSARADHGVVVIRLAGDRIAEWREYQRPGPASFGDFVSTAGKKWEWHRGNYP